MRCSSPSVLPALVLFIYAAFNPAFAADCSCGGTPAGTPFKGGDGKPLNWQYEQYSVSSGTTQSPPLVCYHKIVANKSNLDVRDVRWEVADFFRRIIRNGDLQASCPEFAGELSSTPTSGPLHFGPGADSYDTTVLQPKKGWDQTASGEGGGSRGPTVTALAFDIIDAAGAPTPVLLTFVSEAKSGGGSAYIHYEVENKSDAYLSVLINLTAGKSILATVPLIQKRMELPPHTRRSFAATEEGQAVVKPGLIVVFDSNGQIGAIDSAGFFTVPGAKERSDQYFWELLK